MKKFISYVLDTLIYVINLIKKREFKTEDGEVSTGRKKKRKRNRRKNLNA